ncbi:YSIRK-type signal peptide-containing protein [Lactobacillus delbrueckii subsp. lactis]|uniref:YSIRK-type signal peptide-containing protein n=1 Tax=Lactobacillus delbrueckii TaxID=1584 RepID=UPI001E2E64AC|nr:YSIRK-type signal peptide-containing protein [Lactobacillus delbrueckii]MCD9218667.1 YSIRK-type signal peptide-containing protein [Lactobacillus delbrueckii subsp. lactis]
MMIMGHKHDPNFNSKLNGKEKFGFRKLSIGLVAVALGTSFFVGSGQLVHAAGDTATETVVQQGNASDSSSADTSSSTTVEESTSSESTTEAAEKTNSESTTEGTAPPADEQKQAAVTSRRLNQQKPARRLRKPASRKRM